MLKDLKQFNLPELEEKILKIWGERNVFKKSITNRQKKNAKPFRFFEGPPTANGRPGMHHVLGRAFKDIVLRYKTMRGYYVARKAGWDTHGLPVEIEIEKELGIKSKSEIEKFGIAEFNTRAKSSVWKYKNEWEKLTERVGFWLDFDNPYVTYDNNYIESLWWIFGQIHKRGLLKKIHKVVPWCPRCQTPLSSHELGQPGAYRKTKDPSVYIKFEIKNVGGEQVKRSSKSNIQHQTFLLVWTTTPWTLPANVAIAVDPTLTYTKYKIGDDYLWSYRVPPQADQNQIKVSEKISGKKLVGLSYKPLYSNDGEHKVIAADFVSTEDGTGLVHIAPAFGEDDLRAVMDNQSQNKNIPITIDDRGVMNSGLPGAGKFIKDADKDIIADLEKRKLIYLQETTEHEYPFCWRCSAPLIYFARYSWFIEMSRLRNELLLANKKINWVPSHIKEGRFGEWLREIKDWSIARNRYWGTPLPIWECDNDHQLVVNSLNDLNKHRYSKNKIFFARHTEADHNVKNFNATGPEKGENISKLTKKGIDQAKQLSKRLLKEKIDVIYSSPYYRTKQTATIIGKALGIKIVYDKKLEEINIGIFNGRPAIEHKKFFDNPLEKFTKAPPGGENLTDVKQRMFAALQEINNKHHNQNILIISHGDPLWVLGGAVNNLSDKEILEYNYPQLGEYSSLPSNNWPLDKNVKLDMHRPFIDNIFLKCPKCHEKMTRVKEVADVWFDSGAMPFAQYHYPFENKDLIDKKLQFPADYISEGIDQTRGWFYTLLAVSTLLDKKAPYNNVVSLGLLLDKNGQKMSKSKGNVIDPWQMIQKYGADSIRWYFYTVNPPGEPKRFDENDLNKVLRSFFMMIYNSFNFSQMYDKKSSGPPIKILDKWILARLQETIDAVTDNLEKYEIGDAAKVIEKFVDDLSRWYIRRSRKNVSPETLSIIFETLAKLMAPFAPFFAEALYDAADKKTSVHLADWPKINKKLADKRLLSAMEEIRKLAALGLSAREKAGIKIRQPLTTLTIRSEMLDVGGLKPAKKHPTPAHRRGRSNIPHQTVEALLQLLADEINVKSVVFSAKSGPASDGSKTEESVELDTKITPKLKEEGLMRELARMIQGLRHDANLNPQDIINVHIETSEDLTKVFVKNSTSLKKDVKAKTVEFKKGKFDAELNSKLDSQPIWVGIKKI
ncbi:MAG: class I tRNA ligase family protein [bacterium]|nr:class I tRNA ligase family protein [bacterium]